MQCQLKNKLHNIMFSSISWLKSNNLLRLNGITLCFFVHFLSFIVRFFLIIVLTTLSLFFICFFFLVFSYLIYNRWHFNLDIFLLLLLLFLCCCILSNKQIDIIIDTNCKEINLCSHFFHKCLYLLNDYFFIGVFV